MPTLTIDRRFCGPPASGNGGYSAGLLAAHVDAPVVEVTLRQPPPLDTALEVVVVDGTTGAVDTDHRVVLEARPALLDLPVLPPPSPDQLATAAPVAGFAADHPFPTCFTCGPERAAGDGLCLFPHLIPEGLSPRFATTWTPGSDLPGSETAVAPEIVWAALDCPSCFPFLGPERRRAPIVLGRLTAELLAPVARGVEHVVTSWRLGEDGRKKLGASAIFADRQLVARAAATWIELAT